jgi:hypothetical protein
MNNSSDTIGNRNCDLPVCSAVPQLTAPPRASKNSMEVPFVYAPLFQKESCFVSAEVFENDVI